ncbi:MAG: FAD-dependent oxidoreductase [Campylobacterales bacterium]|nr:FAD-dependent oxidoreductase [Campylobacterales bacterium]
MKRVVVVGGGYGGLRCIEGLEKVEELEIVLVDRNPYHYLQTEAYSYIAGKSDIYDIAIDLASWCEGFGRVKFMQMDVEKIDFDAQTVYANEQSLEYDYLVVGVGARTNFFSFIEGLREHSHGVKFLSKAYNFRKDFEAVLYEKLNAQSGTTSESINIAIGGAGLSGVEVAAEMAHTLREYGKTIGTRAKDVNIYLIDASDTILPGSSTYIIENTMKRLKKLGVNVLTSSFISRVDADKILFKDEKELPYHFMVFTGGIKAAPLTNTIECEKNRIGQLIVDEKLNINNFANAFAIGDCIEVKDKKGRILPPTAQIAERSAEYVAQSIVAKEKNIEQSSFDASVMGVFVALGGSYAVGEMFGFIKVSGYKAYLLKKAITYAYYLGLKLRINTGFKNRKKIL